MSYVLRLTVLQLTYSLHVQLTAAYRLTAYSLLAVSHGFAADLLDLHVKLTRTVTDLLSIVHSVNVNVGLFGLVGLRQSSPIRRGS